MRIFKHVGWLCVFIAAPPSNATIAANVTVILEGDMVTLSCVVHGANPAPNITWTLSSSRTAKSGTGSVRGETVHLVETVRQPADIKFGQVNSMVTFVATKFHHASNVTCQAQNQAGSLQTDFHMTVLCEFLCVQ